MLDFCLAVGIGCYRGAEVVRLLVPLCLLRADFEGLDGGGEGRYHICRFVGSCANGEDGCECFAGDWLGEAAGKGNGAVEGEEISGADICAQDLVSIPGSIIGL